MTIIIGEYMAIITTRDALESLKTTLKPATGTVKVDDFDHFLDRMVSVGSKDRVIGSNLYGFNHRSAPAIMSSDSTYQGLTFFTRPQLNLRCSNLRNNRRFIQLMLKTKYEGSSISSFVRNTLDPRLAMFGDTTCRDNVTKNSNVGGAGLKELTEELADTGKTIASKLVNPQNAFIPALSNTVTSISGWPDITLSTFDGKPGIRKEVYTMADSIAEVNEAYDLDVTFSTIKGNPIAALFQYWIEYISLAFAGDFMPYMDMLLNNVRDSDTRIYRLVLTENKKFVRQWANTGASFPLNVPTGKVFDFNNETPYSDQTKDITTRFKSMGADYNDDISLVEFNKVVGIFKPEMRDVNNALYYGKATNGSMVKVPPKLLDNFNYHGYPRVDLFTKELEWWVDREVGEVLSRVPELVLFQEEERDMVADDLRNINKQVDTAPTGVISGEPFNDSTGGVR